LIVYNIWLAQRVHACRNPCSIFPAISSRSGGRSGLGKGAPLFQALSFQLHVTWSAEVSTDTVLCKSTVGGEVISWGPIVGNPAVTPDADCR
jgi:hypothetical protein